MKREELIAEIVRKKSFLCVGLDSDPEKLPKHIERSAEGVVTFNKAIIEATAPYTVAYKPNAAFYEALGSAGVSALEETVRYLKTKHPECLVILDAKRGDIGNTSGLYARAAFEYMDVDALTVAPYMGQDSVAPFLEYPRKWVVLLALTSNSGSSDFQQLELASGEPLYKKVLRTSKEWATEEQMMYVVGATQASYLKEVRAIVPRHFLLVPGVGAQGGSLADVAQYGMTRECGLLVNSSRGIIFASQEENFAQVAGDKAKQLRDEMSQLLDTYARELLTK